MPLALDVLADRRGARSRSSSSAPTPSESRPPRRREPSWRRPRDRQPLVLPRAVAAPLLDAPELEDEIDRTERGHRGAAGRRRRSGSGARATASPRRCCGCCARRGYRVRRVDAADVDRSGGQGVVLPAARADSGRARADRAELFGSARRRPPATAPRTGGRSPAGSLHRDPGDHVPGPAGADAPQLRARPRRAVPPAVLWRSSGRRSPPAGWRASSRRCSCTPSTCSVPTICRRPASSSSPAWRRRARQARRRRRLPPRADRALRRSARSATTPPSLASRPLPMRPAPR